MQRNKMLRKILFIFAIVISTACCGAGGAHSAEVSNIQNIGMADVGDFGAWNTPNNRAAVTQEMRGDLARFQEDFQTKVLVKDFVPPEARVGKVFVQAMSYISNILEKSLVRFINILLVVLYAFWIMFEGYQLASSGGNSRKTVQDIIMKGVMIGIWIFILEFGPARIFMYIMGPIISVGTYISDMILGAVTASAGTQLPDTCAAIHKFVAADPGTMSILTPEQTANLLCVPTRLSGFFYTAVAAGFKWMLAGIGSSMFTFVIGLVFVCLFIYNAIMFAIKALGIMADLFFSVMFLPFTAIKECFGSAPSYKGIAGNFFVSFTKIFDSQSLNDQVMKFINAILYFISLSIVIAICSGLLSGFVYTDISAEIPTLSHNGFIPVLIIGCLVAYLGANADKFAKQIGGAITEDDFGKNFANDVKNLWSGTKKRIQDIWKMFGKK